MNPDPLTTAQWADTGNALKLLWVSLALVLTASGALLTAHAIIPSATDSGMIPPVFRKLRPILYATGALMIVGMIVAVVLITGAVDFIAETYSRRFQ